MEFQVKITMADPAGNRTAFVEGNVPREYYAAVGAALLKDETLRAEQAGFCCPPRFGGIGRLEMMGGEFCGNASRSFGLWLGRAAGKKAGDQVPVEVSGSSDILSVLLEEDGAWVSMPLPKEIIEVRLPEKAGADAPSALCFPAVVLEGITHVILENTAPSEELARAVIRCVAETTDADAVGAMFLQGDAMTPVVWVRATDSFVWESSCGSGTLSATVWRGRQVKDGAFRLSLHQPGGILEAEITTQKGRVTEARIGGPVHFEKTIERVIIV